jgi:uncharacterized membrane protein
MTDRPPSTQTPNKQVFGDAQMEKLMGRLLQAGVLLASLVVLAGGLLYLREHAGAAANYRTFAAHPLELRHPAAMLQGIAHGEASAIIELGVLLLIFTPILRVVVAVVAFSIERDRLYIAISITVLAVLLYGMLHSV